MAANKTHGRRDQRFGDAGRDHRERRLLHAAERLERAHDAPHRAEQTRRTGSWSRRSRESRGSPRAGRSLELRHAHRAARAFEQLLRAKPPCLSRANSRKPNSKMLAMPCGVASRPRDLPVQRGEVAALPEARLRNSAAASMACDSTRACEDDGPGHERREQQQPHDDLHDRARVEHQPDDRQFVVH